MKVSIIIPVYNASQWIEDCLTSIVNQSLQGIEIVLIDDHGSDDSIEKAKAFAEKNASVSFIFTATQANGGPGVARNVGITAATGKYISFMDADDWIEADLYEKLFVSAEEFQADFLYSNYYEDKDGVSKIIYNVPFRNLKHFLTHYNSCVCGHACLIQRQLIVNNDLQFPPTRSAEDSAFAAEVALVAKNIVKIEKCGYHYIIMDNSLSHKYDKTRASQKRASFAWLMTFANKKKLYCKYFIQLWIIYIKKADRKSVV